MLTIEQIEAAILELPPDKFHQLLEWFSELDYRRWDEQLSSRTQLITQNSGLQALSSKESAKNQCVINSVQLLRTRCC